MEIVVRDSGIGIPRDDLERIFERFYRVDRARSRDTGGTGLGLSIVRHVATNHGGDVSVESHEGEGSTFTLRLPRAVPRAGSQASPTRQEVATWRSPGGHWRTVGSPSPAFGAPACDGARHRATDDHLWRKRLKKTLVFAAAAMALLPTVPALAADGNPLNADAANTFTMAVYGDAPYGTTPTDTAQFQALPGFIDSINADPKVRLVLHVGDIHSGKQYCTQAYDQGVFDLWTEYKDPVVYTPGDNEWTDCNKAGEGGGAYNAATQQIDYVVDGSGNPVDYAKGDPVANLALIRSIFFPVPGVTLGERKRQVISQARHPDRAHPADAKYVENVMWEQSKVLFVTINLPGGSNNDNDVWYGAPTKSAAQIQEINERTAADLRWLDIAFARAAADGVDAVVIGAQADMWDNEKGPAHQAAFEPFVQSVASHTSALAKPVLMFNGDSHVYRSDNPLAASDPLNFVHPGYDVANFHRIVVHGSTFPLEWLRLTISPGAHLATTDTSFGPFSWERMVQP